VGEVLGADAVATFLRDWSFRYPPLYDAIAGMTAVLAGGEGRLRTLAWQDLRLSRQSRVLDLCCGPGGATRYLAARFAAVTGLDCNETSLEEARRKAPGALFVRARAEAMPFADHSFDLVHTSLAMHEMAPDLRRAIFAEVRRVLAPGGTFVLIDYHAPTLPLLWPPLALFLWVFETETAWDLIATDLVAELSEPGFLECEQRVLVGGSLQVVRAHSPA